MNDNKVNEVYCTSDYSVFKHLNGNRSVSEMRVKKIVKSVNRYGYICNPIIVNQYMEVIDGQARCEAFKRCGIPVEYIVKYGLDDNDCRVLNQYQSNWTMPDFIDGYAESGNQSYSLLKQMTEEYNDIPVSIVASALRGSYMSKVGNETLKGGTFICSRDNVNNAKGVLDIIRELQPFMIKEKGRPEYIMMAILYAYSLPDVNKSRLVDKFKKYYMTDKVRPFVNVNGALEAMDAVYNYRQISDVVFIAAQYAVDYKRERSRYQSEAAARRKQRGKKNG